MVIEQITSSMMTISLECCHSASQYIKARRLAFPLSGQVQSRDEPKKWTHQLTLGSGPCGLRAGLATEGGGHDLWGEVEEVSQVLDALVGEVPVEVAPGKLLLDVPARLQGLQNRKEMVHFNLQEAQASTLVTIKKTFSRQLFLRTSTDYN